MTKIIYFNGDIITINQNNEVAQAILIEDGLIMSVGSKEEILALSDESTKEINLNGKTMLPEPINPHRHIVAIAQTLMILNFTECGSKEELLQIIEDKLKNNPPKEGGMDYWFWL